LGKERRFAHCALPVDVLSLSDTAQKSMPRNSQIRRSFSSEWNVRRLFCSSMWTPPVLQLHVDAVVWQKQYRQAAQAPGGRAAHTNFFAGFKRLEVSRKWTKMKMRRLVVTSAN
jgi:hypothetical protein